MNKTKSCFFEKTKKIDKLLENLTTLRRGKMQISKIRNKKKGDNNKYQGNPENHQRIL
jgi:hypothetical protein